MNWRLYLLSLLFTRLAAECSVSQRTSEGVELDYNFVNESLKNLSFDYQSAAIANEMSSFKWATNLTIENRKQKLDDQKWMEIMSIKFVQTANRFIQEKTTESLSKEIQHMMDVINLKNDDPKKMDVINRKNEILAKMLNIYSAAKICKYGSQNESCEKIALNPGIMDILANSRDYDELKHVWVEWRNATGRQMRHLYLEFLNLVKSNYTDYGHEHRAEYLMNDADLLSMLADINREVLPLYEALYTYARRKLRQIYPQMQNQSAIYGHLLGDTWAQNWENLYDVLVPYPTQLQPNVTASLVNKNYTARQMFELGERFFESIGLGSLPDSFWNMSMIERPSDGREVICHGFAYDFANQNDVAIKMCTNIDASSLETVHHELGHTYYYIWYKDEPLFFRTGANPAFHEAIGDTIDFSVSAPTYYQQVGLVPNSEDVSEYQELNELMAKALSRIPFVPWAYVMDVYRWKLYNGSTQENKLNSEWWKLRYQYQGIVPPVERMEGTDFDAGSKYHTADDVLYIKYFLASILSFQIHESLCRTFDNRAELYDCTIFNQKAAGDKLKELLKSGQSEPWPDILERMTGSRTISAKPMMKYFRKLHEWLDLENEKANDCYGWGYDWGKDVALKLPRC